MGVKVTCEQTRRQLEAGMLTDDTLYGVSDETSSPRRPGLIRRWRQRRRQRRLELEQRREHEEHERIDVILEKVHREGIDHLTPAEKRFLNRASAKLRQRDRTRQH